MAKRNRTNNDIQNTTQKTKDTRTPLKTGDELWCSGRVGSSCSTSGTCLVAPVTNPVISNEERTRKCLRQVGYIRGHLRNRYSVTVNQVMVAIVKHLK
jgi:hypothetical protein